METKDTSVQPESSSVQRPLEVSPIKKRPSALKIILIVLVSVIGAVVITVAMLFLLAGGILVSLDHGCTSKMESLESNRKIAEDKLNNIRKVGNIQGSSRAFISGDCLTAGGVSFEYSETVPSIPLAQAHQQFLTRFSNGMAEIDSNTLRYTEASFLITEGNSNEYGTVVGIDVSGDAPKNMVTFGTLSTTVFYNMTFTFDKPFTCEESNNTEFPEFQRCGNFSTRDELEQALRSMTVKSIEVTGYTYAGRINI